MNYLPEDMTSMYIDLGYITWRYQVIKGNADRMEDHREDKKNKPVKPRDEILYL